MELTEITNACLEIFQVASPEQLSEAMLCCCLAQDASKFEAVLALNLNLEEDFLQPLYQFHLSDRKTMHQDFTPKSLAKLVATLVGNNADTVIDICAGSGALLIQAWANNKNCNFVCYEIDNNVIPFLVFNLALRNITATVYNGDFLADKFQRVFHIASGTRFSSVKEIRNDSCNKQSAIQHQMGGRRESPRQLALL